MNEIRDMPVNKEDVLVFDRGYIMRSPEIKTASQDLKVESLHHDMMKKETGNKTTTAIQ